VEIKLIDSKLQELVHHEHKKDEQLVDQAEQVRLEVAQVDKAQEVLQGRVLGVLYQGAAQEVVLEDLAQGAALHEQAQEAVLDQVLAEALVQVDLLREVQAQAGVLAQRDHQEDPQDLHQAEALEEAAEEVEEDRS